MWPCETKEELFGLNKTCDAVSWFGPAMMLWILSGTSKFDRKMLIYAAQQKVNNAAIHNNPQSQSHDHNSTEML